MPPSDEKASLTVPTRLYRYDVGAVGPEATREIPVETPVELVFGGAPYAVMMASPADLEDFAVGFALTEGVIGSLSDIRAVEIRSGAESARIEIALTGERLQAHLARRRAMSGRTGCGICGVEDLEHLPQAPRRTHVASAPSPHAVGAALRALETAQPLNARTRAVHAAAWCDPSGALIAVREDVGRHNALDKLIGAALRAGVDPDAGFVLITSRCSFEMVGKAAVFGAGALVCVSAPTSLALATAEKAGLHLIAIARGDHATQFFGGAENHHEGAAA